MAGDTAHRAEYERLRAEFLEAQRAYRAARRAADKVRVQGLRDRLRALDAQLAAWRKKAA